MVPLRYGGRPALPFCRTPTVCLQCGKNVSSERNAGAGAAQSHHGRDEGNDRSSPQEGYGERLPSLVAQPVVTAGLIGMPRIVVGGFPDWCCWWFRPRQNQRTT